jgi:hypothetical protein
MRIPVTPKNNKSAPTAANNNSGQGRINLEPSFKVSEFQGFNEIRGQVNQSCRFKDSTLKL